ncbi:MAG: di/tricarboxylate transporter [Myxococcota bacterium]|jgi:di/tricarboxylate transporter
MTHLWALEWEAWFTIGVVAAVTVTMAREKLGPDLAMFGGLCVLTVAGVLTPTEALQGFAMPAVATIGVLFVCATAVRETGGLTLVSSIVFGSERRPTVALLRLLVPTAILSAFMNNTPIVAMFIPMARQAAGRVGMAPSKMLIPLAWASMFGGTCTLIGTSANLVVAGLLAQSGGETIGMLEIAWIGVPTSLIGITYLMTVGRYLLPERREFAAVVHEEIREYLVEVEVARDAPFAGQTVGQAGLRSLDGLFLYEIRKSDGRVRRPVAPQHRLDPLDHLVLTGRVDAVQDLIQDFPGLRPVDDEVELVERHLFEVVVSHRSPLVGARVRDADFRRKYGAAILAAHRSGARIEGQIGEIVLEAGDTLMLTAQQGFRKTWQNSSHFYLVSDLRIDSTQAYTKANLALLTILGMVLVPSLTGVPMLVSAMGALVILVATGCVGLRAVRASVNWTVLVLIGSALGVARAMDQSGAAAALGNLLLEATAPFGPRATLAAVYVLGATFASFISNAAAAALVFPIALTAAQAGGFDPLAFSLALAMAASAGFSTPIGSQPNLLVYGPGGYRYADYVRAGLPLNILLAITTVALLPLLWPL